MPGWTNRAKYRTLGQTLRSETIPTNYYVRLHTSATAPTADTNVVSDLTNIAAGNGYTAGGTSLSRNATDFDVWTEDDTNDRALMQVRDITWTASGGNIPASGNGARYATITDDNVTDANREILWYFDLSSDRTVSDGQALTLQDLEVRVTET